MFKVGLFLGVLLNVCAVWAIDVDFKPFARVRYESLANYDLNGGQSDYRTFTGSRFWLAINATHNQYQVLFQPQIGRSWGVDELGNSVSGTTTDPYLNLHQAFAQFPFVEGLPLRLKMGRQELSYGEELVLGSVIWSNVGRSFDAIKVILDLDEHSVDIFTAKLSEKNAVTPVSGDKDLSGVYFKGRPNFRFLKEADIYALNLHDATISPKLDFMTYGLRLLGGGGILGYRIESNLQSEIQGQNQFQMDGEIFSDWDSLGRLTLNYFVASAAYNQLFPTAHRWLGIGDVVSRRNLEGFQIKHKFFWLETLDHEISYHKFQRRDNLQTGFAFNGSSLGSVTSRDDDLGEEYDLMVTFKPDQNLSYQLGAALFFPGDYLRSSNLTETYQFFYLQIALGI